VAAASEWTYFDREHPLYQLAPWQTRDTSWPFTPPELRGAPLEREDGLLTEPLEMRSVAWPGAMRVYRVGSNGPTVQEIRLFSPYTGSIDLGGIEALARVWVDAMVRLSGGPYSGKDLAKQGHPYGWASKPVGQRMSLAAWTAGWQPRQMPGFGGKYRVAKGIKGFMPDRAVINVDSGFLQSHWRMEVLRDADGVTVRIVNDASYAWYLARGTVNMQAHGPWGPVGAEMAPKLVDTWRQAAWAAWNRIAHQRSFGNDAPPAYALSASVGGFS
jgi:hypothetical protein